MMLAPAREHPDKGWAPTGFYRCLGFGCGMGGWITPGTICKVCGTPVAALTMTQERWRREVFDAGQYGPAALAKR